MMRGRKARKMEQRAVGKAVRTGRRIRRAKRAAVIVGAVKLASTRRRAARRTKRAALMVGAAKAAKTRPARRARRAAAVGLATKPQRRMRAR